MNIGPQRQRRRNLALLLAALIVLLAWGWFDVRARAVPETGRLGQKTDITVYLDAGRALRTGQDIYQVHNIRNWPYLYPPLPALLFVPLSHLSRGQASYAWFLVSLGCLAGSVLLMRATLRCVDPERAGRACWLGLLPVALPLFHTLQRGQINALPLLCLCLALYAMARRRDLLAGAALAGAAVIKVTPGFAVVYFGYRWLEHQASAIRANAWRPATLLGRTKPLVGFAFGLLLGLWLIPSLYMGPQSAGAALANWRQTVAGGYFRPDAAGNLFGDTAGIHDASNKNQTWYRAILSAATLFDPGALQGRDLLQPSWQRRAQWILASLSLLLTAGLLWLSRDFRRHGGRSGPTATCHDRSETRDSNMGQLASLAALAWLGITLGKIAWGHFYVMAYPLMAIAVLIARQQPDPRQGRLLKAMLAPLTIAYVVHYSIASQPQISDIGGMLLPTTVLAFATVALANRRTDTVHCGRPGDPQVGATIAKD